MPLKNDWAPGNSFTHADQNAVADAVNTVVSYSVDGYGADPTGATFSDDAVDEAIAALGASPGIIELGVGTYKLNTTKTLAYPGQGIRGQGVGATTIDYRGTGDCLRVWDSTAPTDGSDSPGPSAPITGFRIYGYDNANTNVCGLHMGDLLFPTVTDVRIDGFNEAGCKGFWGENRYTWCERAWLQMDVEHCTQPYVFSKHASHPLTTTSWSYSWFFLSVIAAADQTAFTLSNGTFIEGVDFRLFGNLYPGVTNSGVALQLGTSGGDLSYMAGQINIDVESLNATGVGHKDINTANTALKSLRGFGVLRFKEVTEPFEAGSATPNTVDFAGFVDSPSLGTETQNGRFSVVGVAEFHSSANGVNHLEFTSRATGSPPIIAAAGTDSDISMLFAQKGLGAFAYYADAGSDCVAQAGGDATDVGWDFTTQGTGTVKANSVPVVTTTGTQTQTNKTLTGPIVDQIKHATNSNVMLGFNSSGTRSDYLEITNFGTPAIGSAGSSSNITFEINPKGSGAVRSYVNTQTAFNYYATGDLTNVNFNLVPQGAGRVQEGGNTVGSWIAVPATATSTGKAGQMAADSSWLYICTATNTWRRVAVASW